MIHNILHSVGFLLYVVPLFIGIGILAWLATCKIELTLKRYGMLFAFLFLFPAFIPNIIWDTWQIHLLFPFIYLLLLRASEKERVFDFHQVAQPFFTSPTFALGVFFAYAFVSTAWAYFPMQSFMMLLFQSISIGFTYLIFTRIHHTRVEMFAPNGHLARLCLTIGIASFMLFVLSNEIVPKIYSTVISLFEEELEGIAAKQASIKYLEILTIILTRRTFFDSGFTFFAVLAFPLAMLIRDRLASLLLLGAFFFAVLLVSGSEAAKLSLFLGICITLFLPKLPKWTQQIATSVMLAGITIFPFFVLLPPTMLEFLNSDFIKESSFFISSLEPRLWIYENTILLDIWMRPWFGYGIGATNFDLINSVSKFDNIFFAASVSAYPHNHTLTLLVELGIVGLLLFLWICVCILRTINTLNEQCQPYALGAFFSALCLITFTQHLWGPAIIIFSAVLLTFAFFGRSLPNTTYPTDRAI